MNDAPTLSRITALRQLLQLQQWQGYIVPSNDAFLGEYVPEYDRRLSWLTGFTGSNGIAVVLPHKAAFFTDGRYLLQARSEVDASLFTHYDLTEYKVIDWLKQHGAAGDRVAYEPWLHVKSAVKQWEDGLMPQKVTLAPTKDNLIDQLWQRERHDKRAAVQLHTLEYAGEEAAHKIKTLVQLCSVAQQDACLIAAPDSVSWLLNVRGGQVPYTPVCLAIILVHVTGRVECFTDEKMLPTVLSAFLALNVALRKLSELPPVLQSMCGKKIQLDPALTPVALVQALEKAGAILHYATDPCQLPKSCKNAVELAGMRACHIKDGVALTEGLYWLEQQWQQGHTLTEIAVADTLLATRKKQSLYVMPSFATIAGFKAHGAIVHYHATPESNATITPDGLLLIDSGGQYYEGTTDVTRTVAIGAVTDTQKEHFTRVLKGHIALALASFPQGTTGSQLDALARYWLWEDGLDYAHGTGHGVGSFLSVHEGPQRISKIPNSVALAPGMILSNEPGYYLEGEYGIRIESLVAVVESKKGIKPFLCFETLTQVPFDRRLIATALLTERERAWVDAYHAQVYQTLAPFLAESTRVWCQNITRPLA